jgi:Reverse transcriptase (RNA-dependent DNA polymerase)
VSIEHLPEKLKGFTVNVLAISIPKRVEEALKDKKWTETMKAEIEILEKNHTWKLVELLEGKKTVGCKWIYSIKYNANGEIEGYKVRLVVKGYTQIYDIDFQKKNSSIVKLNTVRVPFLLQQTVTSHYINLM